jgi:hypothetical protein
MPRDAPVTTATLPASASGGWPCPERHRRLDCRGAEERIVVVQAELRDEVRQERLEGEREPRHRIAAAIGDQLAQYGGVLPDVGR